MPRRSSPLNQLSRVLYGGARTTRWIRAARSPRTLANRAARVAVYRTVGRHVNRWSPF
jgi:hypothetical protein